MQKDTSNISAAQGHNIRPTEVSSDSLNSTKPTKTGKVLRTPFRIMGVEAEFQFGEHVGLSPYKTEKNPYPAQLRTRHQGKNRGSDVCITEPPKLQILSKGLDYLKLSCVGLPTDEATIERLAVLKDKARQGEEPTILLGGRVWHVDAIGNRAKGRGSLRYQLRSGGLTLWLGDRKSGLVAQIEGKGQFCGGRDPQQVHREMKDVVCRVGVKPSEQGFTVTRLDIYGDQAGVHVRTLAENHAQGNAIYRATQTKTHTEHGMVSGMYFGQRTSGMMLRVYDKWLELAKNPEKRENYLAANNLQTLPHVITRVEYEIHWDKFKALGFQNSDEVFASLSKVSRYLMEDWYRPCHTVDRNHTERAKPLSWWKNLTDKVCECLDGFATVIRRPKIAPRIERAKKQIMAHAATIFGKLGIAPPSLKDGFNALLEYFTPADDQWFVDRIETRVIQFEENRNDWERFIAWNELQAEKLLAAS